MNHPTLRAALRANIPLSEATETSLNGFLDEYFGTSQDTPFGGREDELQALDAWFTNPAYNVALVVSEAGKGKSALLTQWAARIATQGIRVAFAPISIRFGTSLRGPALRLLAQELAALTGRKLSEIRHVDALRADCEAMLSSPQETPLLVVLDGIDEATGWQLTENIVFSTLSPQCKILLSARTSPGLDALAWSRKLGLDPQRTSIFVMRDLSQASVNSLLATIADDPTTAKNTLSQAIYRLSAGDPLLVRLYLEFLRASPQSLENLPQTPPGLEGWFSLWWSQLRARWVGNPVMEPLAEDIFDLLATALGPLPRKTLLTLLQQNHKDPDLEPRVDFLLQDIRPLLLGDGERIPLTLSHPRLRYFRLEQMHERQREALEERFLTVGNAELETLCANRLTAAQASSYFLRYLAAHIDGRPNSFDQLEKLVCPAWQAAWEALEGTYDGFLDDVHRAWTCAETIARTDISRRGISLAVIARCALVFSSVASLVYSLPPNLAGHLVEQGIWTPAVALAQSRWPSGGYRSETLVSLAPYLDLPLLRKALTEAVRTQYLRELNQAEGIAACLARMIELGAASEVPRYVEAFPLAVRALIGTVSWRHLPKELHPLAARWIDEGAGKVDHCSQAAATVFASLPILSGTQRTQLINAAMTRLWDEDFGLDTEHAAFLAESGEWKYGWDEATKESMAYPTMNMFAAIAPHLPEDKKTIAYDKWFVAAQKILTERFSLLSMVVPNGLSGRRLQQFLQLIRSKPDDRGIAKPLVVLSYEHPELRQEACIAVKKLTGPHGAIGRLALAPVMDPETANRLALEAYRLLLIELDRPENSDCWNADASWPRGPGFKHWCYMGDRRYAPVLIAECLRWMLPIEKARCVRELFARFRRIADNDAILATAATLAYELPKESRASWARKLSVKRRNEKNIITLVSLGTLLQGEDQHAMAIEAWNGTIATDTQRVTGEALARATRWIPENERESLQIAAIDRWMNGPHFSNVGDLSGAIGAALTHKAALFWISKEAESHGWILESLAHAVAKHEQALLEKRLAQALRDLHQIPWTILDLYRHIEHAGDVIAAYLREEHSWRHFREERAAAISLWPLYASGHVDLAEKLRKTLTRDVSKRIATMAYALYRNEGKDEALRAAFAPWSDNGGNDSLVVESALLMFGPRGYLRKIVEYARSSNALWIATMRGLEKVGYIEVLQEELRAEQIDEHRKTIFSCLDAKHWVKKANDSTLIECWIDFWRDARNLPRRRALGGVSDHWFSPLSSIISTLTDAAGIQAVLQEVLLIGDWFA